MKILLALAAAVAFTLASRAQVVWAEIGISGSNSVARLDVPAGFVAELAAISETGGSFTGLETRRVVDGRVMEHFGPFLGPCQILLSGFANGGTETRYVETYRLSPVNVTDHSATVLPGQLAGVVELETSGDLREWSTLWRSTNAPSGTNAFFRVRVSLRPGGS